MTQKSLQLYDIHLPINSLDAYLQYVNEIPLLTQIREHELALNLQKNNDLDAAKQLVLAHLRYVVKVARGYLGYGLPLNDLIQEGNIGLMKAVKRFNPDAGVRLVTFAIHWIKAEIHEFVLRNWRIVKVATTKAQRKLFFNLRNMKKRLGWLTNEEVGIVANDLKVKPETVREMELRLHSSDMSFDYQPTEDEDQSEYATPAGFLASSALTPEAQLELNDWTTSSEQALQIAIEKLDERSKEIVAGRWLNENKLTLQDLAEKYQISAERVRQLEKNAMLKLRKLLEQQ